MSYQKQWIRSNEIFKKALLPLACFKNTYLSASFIIAKCSCSVEMANRGMDTAGVKVCLSRLCSQVRMHFDFMVPA